MRFTKEQAVAIAIKCGKEYKSKLAETQVLIIYRDQKDNVIKDMEIIFCPSNFQHLTGLTLLDKKGTPLENCSVRFYHKCSDKKPSLSPKEIQFKPDGTTPLKLYALPYVMDITKITKICGDYNHIKPKIEADAIVGSVHSSLAISKFPDSNKYFPRSGLLEDIRDIVTNVSQVLAVFQKPLSAKTPYVSVKYVAKGLNLKSLRIPKEIQEKITSENIIKNEI